MIKNVIGAVIGAKLAGPTSKADSAKGATTGALAASAIPFVLSRMSLPTMLAVGVAGYYIKKHYDKNGRAA
ncbi:hypothetical protein [Blastomonas sp. SL216]|uniref:hypothetical protein n=1 Tax=Blastomonas sp. SL216 TaxID=2995169 RepID=UPI0023773A81|nr:hypothetical protein OU999_07945 [Blastomonas sp. SL216]